MDPTAEEASFPSPSPSSRRRTEPSCLGTFAAGRCRPDLSSAGRHFRASLLSGACPRSMCTPSPTERRLVETHSNEEMEGDEAWRDSPSHPGKCCVRPAYGFLQWADGGPLRRESRTVGAAAPATTASPPRRAFRQAHRRQPTPRARCARPTPCTRGSWPPGQDDSRSARWLGLRHNERS